MTICILGRQPKIGLAELEALFGAEKVSPLGDMAALVDVESTALPHDQLGGTIKVAKRLAILPTTNWQKISAALPDQLGDLPEPESDEKLTLGLSAYGLPISTKQLERAGLELKKSLRAAGRPVRVVPNKSLALNSAQVMHNRLTEPSGLELLIIAHQNQTYLAKTISVQDVDQYAKRDFARPRRDAAVGMLPPKLAQIMLNLAQVRPGQNILDPFCGTGVVLQEAALRGCAVYGSDISERMVRYSRDNLNWLQISQMEMFLEIADATNHVWRQPIDSVVCETYLGPPLNSLPSPDKLSEIIRDCDAITRQFLINLHPQLKKNTRCCIAVPAWRQGKNFVHLPVVDDLEKIGYNRISFKHARLDQLIYHRPDQIVARELLVVTTK